jgi:hypothetical protein
MGKILLFYLTITGVFVLLPVQCASTSEREKAVLNVSHEDITKYENLLVDLSQYTTSGVEYHKKYHKYLIGIGRMLTEEYKLSVVNKSIGFYYDKKESVKDRLYMGIDVNVPIDFTSKNYSFERIATIILEKNLKSILTVVHSCKSIFLEKEIIGMVVGFRWEESNRQESVNIWIDEKDVMRFENNQLTLDELISRNSVTNSAGKVIRILP